MSGLTVTTPPSALPIGEVETRNYLRIDTDVDTNLVTALMTAARDWAENFTNRTLINTTYTLSLDAIGERDQFLREGMFTGAYQIPYLNYIELPRSPVASVTHIKSFNDANTESTLAASNYYSDLVREPARVVLRDGGSWPTDLRNANGIEVQYVAGYGSSGADVPEPIRVAMFEYVTFLYEHRGDFERFPPPRPPVSMQMLLQPYVIMRYGVSAFGGGY